MYSGIILAAAILLYVAVCIVWGIFVRKLQKARIRGIMIIFSTVAAIITTLALKRWLVTDEFINDTLLPFLQTMLDEGAFSFLQSSPALCNMLLSCAGGLVAPILLVASFTVYSLLTLVLYLLIVLILGRRMKEWNAESHLHALRATLWTVVKVLCVITVWMVPVAVYSEIAPIAADAVEETNVISDEGASQIVSTVSDETTALNENVIVISYRALGGEKFCRMLTDFNVKGETTHLRDELRSLATVGCGAYKLSQTEVTSYGKEEADAMNAVADAFSESGLLPAVVSDVLYEATGSWLNGRPFAGIERDAVYVDQSGLCNDFIDALLKLLHSDSVQKSALCADVKTVAQIAGALAENGVFRNITGEDINALVSSLGKEGLVNSLITILGENESMKVLIPEITNIGIRAIATQLGIKEDADVAYTDFLDTVSEKLNGIRKKKPSEQVTLLSEALCDAFDSAGMVVDRSIIDCYSVSMIEDLLKDNENDVTPEDVKAFFVLYALNTDGELPPLSEPEAAAPNGTTALALQIGLEEDGEALLAELLKGTVYEGKTSEELASTGAAVLASVSKRLSGLKPLTEGEGEDQMAVSVKEQATKILTEEYGTILTGSDSKALLNAIKKVTVKKALSADTLTNTAALRDVTRMKEKTVLVTLDQLLVDTEEAAKKLTDATIGNEAEAIEKIFSSASELLDVISDPSDIEISSVASSIGVILDALSDSGSYGKEQTSNLFTAVLQTETVREAAGNIDIGTATDLGRKGSEGDVSYQQTLETVSDTINVINSLDGDSELTEEEIVKLIRGINPQTAGMIEIYVTSERLTEYDVPEDYAETAAPMLSSLFRYMSDGEMDDAQYQKEAGAINDILSMTMAARDKSEESKTLFGAEDGLFESADKAVGTLMASKSVAYALRETLKEDDGSIKHDPFDLSEIIDKENDRDEEKEFIDAFGAYYAANRTAENKETIELLGALFGLDPVLLDEALI